MAARSGPDRTGRLAIIAGGGYLPLKVAEAARSVGDEPVVIVLRDEADRDFSGFDHQVAGIADFAGIQKLIRAKGVKRVVLSGAVRRRPGLTDIRPTWRIIGDVPSIVRKLFAGGDDAVLQMVIGLFQGMGCRVVGVHEILPDLLADVGSLGTVTPTAADLRDIDAAAEAAHILGKLDIGQGAVSVGGRVVALEGAEGTDAVLERVGELRQIGRISKNRRGVLVKMCKPQQDMRVDLPTIGPSTVQAALDAGLAGIAVEAGRALVLERKTLLDLANQNGIFVCGIDLGLPRKGL
ncbi:LpxI family protein [Rhizobium oryzicola]|uniref:LpxI family protein n=1 Tax=Rhizobium oryzicola TaxID=1232668 RepID=A0ABT8SZX9_9HYPH|nr:LpxI family protein [Rhizobium oryzicola]MDO1583921.1 LpxI family protein [Rhizobium oryzicola]